MRINGAIPTPTASRVTWVTEASPDIALPQSNLGRHTLLSISVKLEAAEPMRISCNKNVIYYQTVLFRVN